MEEQAKYVKSEVPQKKGNELAILKKEITDSVLNRIQPMLDSKEIRLPANYSVGNAIHSAWFDLIEMKDSKGVPVLQSCTRESIANSLFKMSVWGLSVAKKQVAFIPYDGKLNCQPEYHGAIALAKRYGKVKDVNYGIVYKGDTFEYAVNVETGRKKILKHEQLLENINTDQIRGAYCVLTFESDTEPYLEVMTIDQIRKAWMQGAMKGNSPAHKNFTDQMAAKTVISRACKLFFTSSDDSVLMEDDETEPDVAVKARDEKVTAKAGKKTIQTEKVEFEDVDKTKPPDVPDVSLNDKEEVFIQSEPGY